MTSGSTTSSSPRRILVRAPNWVGDVLMATPALRALHHGYPDAELVVTGRPSIRPLLDQNPNVQRFIPLKDRGLLAFISAATQLRREDFDWAILLPDSARSALLASWAGIPVRIGFARDWMRRRHLSHTLTPPTENGKRAAISMVERYLRISRELGCDDRGTELDLALDPLAAAAIDQRLADAGVASAELLVVTPGASFGASKLWPPEHFAAACDRLQREFGLHPIIAPGPGEEAVAAAVVKHMSLPSTCLVNPVTSLSELVALVDRATLLLSNDTGPRHIAVARQCRVITLMGPTDPRHTEHLMEKQRVLTEPTPCSPCHLKTCPIDHPCMVGLSPDKVINAAKELLH